jgi:PleD family two-component response regulator
LLPKHVLIECEPELARICRKQENSIKTILLIEDNADSARLVVRIMKSQGYRLLHASDGESGLQLAVQEKPNLILTENLPTNDPHWPALQKAGYLQSFSRIEMRLDLS